jgi:hypothetical protein
MKSVIGWRKLSGWGLVYLLVAVLSWKGLQIPENNVELLWKVTLFFFGANAFEHMKDFISVSVGGKK